MYKVTGVVDFIGETEQITEKFQKREVIVVRHEVNNFNGSEYEIPYRFQLIQNNCSLADALIEGLEVEVSFSITGNRSKDDPNKVFNNLNAIKFAVQAAPAEDDDPFMS